MSFMPYDVFYARRESEGLWEVGKLNYFHWLGKQSAGPELVSQTGVSLAVQVETKLPTWIGLHWTAATLMPNQGLPFGMVPCT
jgi:hypothetical protein